MKFSTNYIYPDKATCYEIKMNQNIDMATPIYKGFFRWMLDSIENNKEEVLLRDLHYLKKPFDNERESIALRLGSSDKNLFKLICFNNESSQQLKEVFDDFKDIYDFMNQEEEILKDYNHFNRLLSWFTTTPINIDEFIDILDSEQRLGYVQEDKEQYSDFKYKLAVKE